jgi:hypothetical protein
MRSKEFLSTGLGLLGLGFSAFAAYVAFSLSAIHLGGTPTCPVVFGIPACVIVLLCYVLITIAWGMMLAKKQGRWPLIIFTVGFVPAFLLALMGSTGEIFGFANCPATETGFPKCFISLAFLIALAVGWAVASSLRKKT